MNAIKIPVLALTVFALGFALGRGDRYAFAGVAAAAAAGTLVGSVTVATFVVVQLGRAQPRPGPTHESEVRS